MAYADDLEGPWATFGPGVLDLEDSFFASPEFSSHVASPDVHVDDENRQIRMYYHGVVERGVQRSRVALSEDGISFEAREELLGIRTSGSFSTADITMRSACRVCSTGRGTG